MASNSTLLCVRKLLNSVLYIESLKNIAVMKFRVSGILLLLLLLLVIVVVVIVRVRFLLVSLEFFIDIIIPNALRPWG